MKLTIRLQIIIVILLTLIYVSGKILVIEMGKTIPEVDYSINHHIFSDDLDEGLENSFLREMINSFEEDKRERKFKYYKKLEIVNYCKCNECRKEWTWGNPPKWKMLTPEISVASNPKTLEIGTHIRIGEHEMIVHYNDESIPINKIYVYLEEHTRKQDSKYLGVYDVYKEY